MGKRQYYISKISNMIETYRENELHYSMSEDHIERWVQQFDLEDQEIILKETFNLISKCYFNEEKIKDFLQDLISLNELWDQENAINDIGRTQFLNIQSKGSSQIMLLNLLNNMILNKYGVEISTVQTEETVRYLYLDDCLFSGNTLRRDLEKWILNAKDNSRLDIVYLGTYSAGEYYIANRILNDLCGKKGIQYYIWAKFRFKNFQRDWHNYDCMWPKATDDQNVSEFIKKLEEQAAENGWSIRLFREREYESQLFTDNNSREIFEQAMLKAGAYIHSCCANPKASMKPMGYEFFNSLGFGAFFATFNNISNNSPLAFWWGDPNAPQTHPLSKWYPLLPRKVNDNEIL